jgi:hypothetical protein
MNTDPVRLCECGARLCRPRRPAERYRAALVRAVPTAVACAPPRRSASLAARHATPALN